MPDLTVDDFMTGLLAALALSHRAVVPIDSERFDAAVEASFHKLEDLAPEYGLNIRFWIATHPLHGDSPVVRDAISGAVQRDLVSLDNPEYQHMRLKITADEALMLLQVVPGGRELFAQLVAVLLNGPEGNVDPPADHKAEPFAAANSVPLAHC